MENKVPKGKWKNTWPADPDLDRLTIFVAIVLVWTVYFYAVYAYRMERIKNHTTPEQIRAEVLKQNVRGFVMELPRDQMDADWMRDIKRWFAVSDIEQGNKNIVSALESLSEDKFGNAASKVTVIKLCQKPWFQSRLLGFEQFASYTLLAVSVGILSSRRRRIRKELKTLKKKGTIVGVLPVSPEDAGPLADGTDRGQLFADESAISFIGRGIFSTFHRSWDVHAALVVGEDRVGKVERYFETSISYVTFALAALPTIGFEGTVRGLADALAFANSPDNLPQVVAGLSIAFDSTFMALMIWLVLRVLQDSYFRRVDDLSGRLQAIVTSATESLELDYSDRKTVQRFIEAISTQASAMKNAKTGIKNSQASITAAQAALNKAKRDQEIAEQFTGIISSSAEEAINPKLPEPSTLDEKKPIGQQSQQPNLDPPKTPGSNDKMPVDTENQPTGA